MKKTMITLTLLTALLISASSGDKKMKSNVANTSTKEFTGATDIKWQRNVNITKPHSFTMTFGGLLITAIMQN